MLLFQNDWSFSSLKDALGSWGYWSVPNGNGHGVPCLWQGKILALGIFSFLFLAWSPLASQRVLIVWECHLQSLNILLPSSPPGFACDIILHSSCPSIRHGQVSELSSQEMCVHYQPSYQHQNPVNHSDLRGPPACLVNKGLMSAIAFYSLFFFLEWGFLITQLRMQTLKEH